MPIISFASPKGGVGKTTSAAVLACELARAGSTVTIIDADPNYPLVAWSQLPGCPANITVMPNDSDDTILDEIQDAAERTKYVIVDLEGTANMKVTYAISMSHLVIVPSQASMLDAREAYKAVEMIQRTERVAKRKIPYRVLFSKMPSSIRTRNYKDLRYQYEEEGIGMLDVQMIEREAFRSMFSFGGSIHSLKKTDVSGLSNARENAARLTEQTIRALATEQAAANTRKEDLEEMTA